MSVRGRTAVVTGASTGIGREIALALAAEGARVGLVARSVSGLEETVRLSGTSTVLSFPGDLRKEQEIARVGESVLTTFGDVDVLVNAAGSWHDDHESYRGPLLANTPAQQVKEVVEVGLLASMLLSRILMPGMITRRSGKILQIACGFAGPQEAVGWLHYYVTNKSIEAFTLGLAAEVRQYEIQVNCIAPWFVATEPVLRFFPDDSKTALDPKDVARLAKYLVSDAADHISGQVIEMRSKRDYGI